MDRIKVVVIDDNMRFRHIIREVIEAENDIQICDEADNLEQAKNILAKYCPDIALLDISVDGREGGLQFLKEVCKLKMSTSFIILSNHNEVYYSGKSLQAGAKGYICKDKTVRCLAHAIRSVQAGKEFVSSDN